MIETAPAPVLGYDVPALPGLTEAEVQTPCLILDVDALERNIAAMQKAADALGVRLRAHGKMHKCADVARLQVAAGAVGLCCQKVSEAEAFVRAGIDDVLVSNQIVDPLKIERLAGLAARARIGVCVDDAANVAALSAAAAARGVTLDVLVEIDCGARRCGVAPGAPAAALAQVVAGSRGLRFAGVQAYQGSAQHIADFGERRARIDAAVADVRATLDAIAAAGLSCPTVTGAGTGTFGFEGASGLYTEIQCGSYAFMDADYARVHVEDGSPLPFEHALFLLTQVISTPAPGRAVCDAGLKVLSVDSGLPVVWGADGIAYARISDEHGVIEDPTGTLRLGDRLRLVPGHCDPTVNLHDWLVAMRGGVVEALWPVTARGKAL